MIGNILKERNREGNTLRRNYVKKTRRNIYRKIRGLEKDREGKSLLERIKCRVKKTGEK